jgi:hypothetical protein
VLLSRAERKKKAPKRGGMVGQKKHVTCSERRRQQNPINPRGTERGKNPDLHAWSEYTAAAAAVRKRKQSIDRFKVVQSAVVMDKP